MYSNWLYSQQTHAQMDASVGGVLLSTGEKPRALFQASCYNGTNTAASQIALVIVPATAGAGIFEGQMAVDGNVGFVLGNVDNGLDAVAELLPLTWGPFATKGAGVGSPIAILPPNSYLFAAAINATNGTIVVNCISAELE